MRPSNRGWRLDYFLVNKIGMDFVKDSLIHNQYEGSDHCPIELVVNFKKEKEEKKKSDEKEEKKKVTIDEKAEEKVLEVAKPEKKRA